MMYAPCLITVIIRVRDVLRGIWAGAVDYSREIAGTACRLQNRALPSGPKLLLPAPALTLTPTVGFCLTGWNHACPQTSAASCSSFSSPRPRTTLATFWEPLPPMTWSCLLQPQQLRVQELDYPRAICPLHR